MFPILSEYTKLERGDRKNLAFLYCFKMNIYIYIHTIYTHTYTRGTKKCVQVQFPFIKFIYIYFLEPSLYIYIYHSVWRGFHEYRIHIMSQRKIKRPENLLCPNYIMQCNRNVCSLCSNECDSASCSKAISGSLV